MTINISVSPMRKLTTLTFERLHRLVAGLSGGHFPVRIPDTLVFLQSGSVLTGLLPRAPAAGDPWTPSWRPSQQSVSDMLLKAAWTCRRRALESVLEIFSYEATQSCLSIHHRFALTGQRLSSSRRSFPLLQRGLLKNQKHLLKHTTRGLLNDFSFSFNKYFSLLLKIKGHSTGVCI